MKSVTIPILVLVLVAFGCGDEQSPGSSASKSSGDAGYGIEDTALTSPDVAKCLETIASGNPQAGLAACQKALASQPNNALVST